MEGLKELENRKDEIIEQISKLARERDDVLTELNDIYKKGKTSESSPIKLSNRCYELIKKISELREEIGDINDSIHRIERGL